MTNVSSDLLELTDSDLKTIEGLETEEARSLILEILKQLDRESEKIAQKSSLLRLFAHSVRSKAALGGPVAE
jgi:DNA-binding MarR family transcriptional regulator